MQFWEKVERHKLAIVRGKKSEFWDNYLCHNYLFMFYSMEETSFHTYHIERRAFKYCFGQWGPWSQKWEMTEKLKIKHSDSHTQMSVKQQWGSACENPAQVQWHALLSHLTEPNSNIKSCSYDFCFQSKGLSLCSYYRNKCLLPHSIRHSQHYYIGSLKSESHWDPT